METLKKFSDPLLLIGFVVNPLMTNVPHHKETSQLICDANQLTDFYTMRNIVR